MSVAAARPPQAPGARPPRPAAAKRKPGRLDDSGLSHLVGYAASRAALELRKVFTRHMDAHHEKANRTYFITQDSRFLGAGANSAGAEAIVASSVLVINSLGAMTTASLTWASSAKTQAGWLSIQQI